MADAVARGATVLAGGNARPDLGPLFFEPTVLSKVDEDMEVCRNETFGPLVSIYPVADVEEAIARANDTEYGLNSSVWAGASRGRGGRAAAHRNRERRRGIRRRLGSTGAPMGGMGISGRPPSR